ncbi:amino acid transporter [uncultured Devosia sp.]|uniref:amino acid transporter n=1 Tax=uncultured Devosia sp. TaxID=211434 RepID=UPI0035CA2AAE
MSTLVRNEQRKLTATYMNGIAIAMLGVGGFAPLAALVQAGTVSFAIALFVAGCILGSASLHSLARHHLRSLEE